MSNSSMETSMRSGNTCKAEGSRTKGEWGASLTPQSRAHTSPPRYENPWNQRKAKPRPPNPPPKAAPLWKPRPQSSPQKFAPLFGEYRGLWVFCSCPFRDCWGWGGLRPPFPQFHGALRSATSSALISSEMCWFLTNSHSAIRMA